MFVCLFLRIQAGVFPNISPTNDLVNALLEKVYVGPSKDSFSVVETIKPYCKWCLWHVWIFC